MYYLYLLFESWQITIKTKAPSGHTMMPRAYGRSRGNGENRMPENGLDKQHGHPATAAEAGFWERK